MARKLTRRGLARQAAVAGTAIGSSALLGVEPTLGAGASLKRCTPHPAGSLPAALAITPDARLLWVTDTAGATITPVRTRDLQRGRSIAVGGAPVDIAISADGRMAIVLTAFYDRPGLAIVDLERRRLARRIRVGDEPHALAISADGERAYVSGGGAKGTLTPVNLRTGSAGKPIAVGAHPRGVAVAPDGRAALVAINGRRRLSVVDLERRRVTRRIATAPFPYRVAISPHGRRAVVSHSGYGAHEATLIDLTRNRVARKLAVGDDPCGVGFTNDGSAVVVSDYGAAEVTVIDLLSGRRRTAHVGHRPRGLAIGPRGARAYVINEFEGTVSRVPLPRTLRGRVGGNA